MTAPASVPALASNEEIRRALSSRPAGEPAAPPAWTSAQLAAALTISRLSLIAALDALKEAACAEARLRQHSSGRLKCTFAAGDSVATYSVGSDDRTVLFDRAERMRPLTGRDGLKVTAAQLGEILSWSAPLARPAITITEHPTGLIAAAGGHRLLLN